MAQRASQHHSTPTHLVPFGHRAGSAVHGLHDWLEPLREPLPTLRRMLSRSGHSLGLDRGFIAHHRNRGLALPYGNPSLWYRMGHVYKIDSLVR
jgi:hypothetical protein